MSEPAPALEQPGAAAPRRRGASLLTQALALFVVIGLGPAVLVALLLTEVNRDAVEVSERQLQAAVLAEIAGSTVRLVEDIEKDVRAVAAAIALGAAQPEEEKDAMAGVRSLVATLPAIDAVRFEVPAAKVSTVISRSAGVAGGVPEATPELRAQADERGVGFEMTGPGVGTLVVPVAAAKPGAVRGYVTARADLRPLAARLESVASTRFEGACASLVVADGKRRAVAAYRVPGVVPGADIAALPVWGVLPAGTPWSSHMAVVNPHVAGGTAMVGGVETVAALGWAVAIWRPQDEAYKTLAQMRQRSLLVGAGSLLLALVAGLLAARAIARPVLHLAEQARLIGRREWRALRLGTKRRDELGELARSIATMAQDLETGEAEIEYQAKLRGDLSRFMSKELVDAIVSGEHPIELGGKRAVVTVMFADVVAFTPMAESRPPEEAVAVLNELFSVLSEVVFRHQGTVDKFIGDCLMGVWGAPVPQEDHAERALRAAEDMMRFLETANEEWREKFDVEIRLGIGINSGEALVGNIGSNKRMEYTVVGDTVNVAARLEAVAKPNQVLVAENTYALCKDKFALIPLGEQNLTGRKSATKVYALDLEG
ncbi:MAG: adenylate/guanylate cyclase domain-containing protein [Deltaproteobacteria bacterium]|nr:adenylate/guanylate cyclase domain-containing protein [Deltaproteobacteria bacterium]